MSVKRSHQPCEGAPTPGKASHKDADDGNDGNSNMVRHSVSCVAAKVLVHQQAHGNLSSNHLRSALIEKGLHAQDAHVRPPWKHHKE